MKTLVDEESKKIIREIYAKDFELYEYVRKRFNQQIVNELTTKEFNDYKFMNKFSKNIIRLSNVNKKLKKIFKIH